MMTTSQHSLPCPEDHLTESGHSVFLTQKTLALGLKRKVRHRRRRNQSQPQISHRPCKYFKNSFLKLFQQGRFQAQQFQANAVKAFRLQLAGLPTVKRPLVRRFPKKKLLLLDLDQTLLSTGPAHQSYEFKVSYFDKAGQEVARLGLNFRPFASEFISRVCDSFEVGIFTAGTKDYADPLIDTLDPAGRIAHRFYAQHCLEVPWLPAAKLKSLQQFGVPLGEIALVDNSPFSLVLDPLNGIPVIPFYNDKSDRELLALGEYLAEMSQDEDVRKRNSQQFKTDLWGAVPLAVLFS